MYSIEYNFLTEKRYGKKIKYYKKEKKSKV